MDLQILIMLILSHQTHLLLGCSADCCGCYPSDCQYYRDLGHNESGLYHVTPDKMRFGFEVYCDMTTDGGGWLVFQRRENGDVDFYKKWANYEDGFGNKSHEHWLGLTALRRILSQGFYGLRIDLEDWEGKTRYAYYSVFNIGNSASSYKLEVLGYSGTAGDSLRSHNGQKFSTKDKDNDLHNTINCPEQHHGAWWYASCRSSNLNGFYYTYGAKNKNDGIHWRQWLRDGEVSNYSMKKVEMKIRKG